MNQPRDPRIPYTNPANLHFVSAPLTTESIREYFVDNSIVFMISYKQSVLKDKLLLTYITNLKMPVDIVFDSEEYSDYAALMLAYFEQRTVVKCDALTGMAIELILYFAGVQKDKCPYDSNLPEQWLEDFCRKHGEVLAQWRIFLDSMVMYIGMKVMKLDLQSEEEILIVDDRDAIGHNVVNLIAAPDFLTTYLEFTSPESNVYFKKQFEDNMFGGRDLAYYFYSPGNKLQQFLHKDVIDIVQSEKSQVYMRIIQKLENRGN